MTDCFACVVQKHDIFENMIHRGETDCKQCSGLCNLTLLG